MRETVSFEVKMCACTRNKEVATGKMKKYTCN